MSGSDGGRPGRMPGAGELAEMLREGASTESIAAAYGVAAITVQQKVTGGGYNGVTGEPRTTRRGPRKGGRDTVHLPGAWRFDAACNPSNAEAFHVARGADTRPAKKECRACPVRQECLTFALENDEREGIWGGLDENERRALRKKGLTAAPVVEPDADGRRRCPHCPESFVYLARLASHVERAHPEEGAA